MTGIEATTNLEAVLLEELRYFDSDEQRQAFLAARTAPTPLTQSWSWGKPVEHTCIVVARDSLTQIVWCATGFGPESPWSSQAIGTTDMGMDCDWHSYLYEAFVTSTMWPEGAPDGFMHMARGEREPQGF
jgi:hypothetical protein